MGKLADLFGFFFIDDDDEIDEYETEEDIDPGIFFACLLILEIIASEGL